MSLPEFDITKPLSVEQDAALAISVLRGFAADAKPFTSGDALRVVQAIERLAESGIAPQEGGWRCFHCGEAFTDRRCAARHFGVDEDQTPACQIKGSEGGLLKALREAEDALYEATAALHAESGETMRAWAAQQSRHHAALISAEETGYMRGLRDSSIADGHTYAVQHNPNCPKPYLVRLPRGVLDLLPVDRTRDFYAYGLSFLEAFGEARAQQEAGTIGELLAEARAK